MKKIITEFFIITLSIFLLFKYNIQLKNNIEIIFYEFIKNVLPTMFPIIFITNYINYNILSKTNNKLIKFFSLCFSFTPSNALITKNNEELLFSYNLNPLFSYTMLNVFFNKYQSIIIILINLIINYTLLYTKLNNNVLIKNKTKSVASIINISINNIINIFGVLIFFNIIINLLSVFFSKKYLFFLEITNGFIIIKSIKNIFLKNILCIFLNSFSGIAIFFQIKSINESIKYKLLIQKLFLAIIVSIISVVVLLII